MNEPALEAVVRTGRKVHGGLAALGSCAIALLAVTGCSSNTTDGSPQSSAPASSSASTLAKFDPCQDIPQSVLTAENLENRGPDNSKAAETTWTGCGFQDRQADGYDVRIVTTNLTLDQIKAKYPDTYREQNFGSRRAAFYTLFPSLGTTSCVLNIELASGTLEFDLSNPKSAKKTGQMDTCALLTNLAGQVVASIPAGA
ncbi:DUF3558 domain-containing protein [Nocardia sp. CA-128927]|uniref:DUF3558 domain-containing protein n=1 Tax=Nocardia sp. CA-128927 TaxID=3239975 RepID=UPI003D986D5E